MRTDQTYPTPSEQTVRKHLRTLRAVFNWAKHYGYVRNNPFAELQGRPLPSGSKHHVALDELDKLLTAAPSPGWRCMFALCRLAGLRRDEARTLSWSGRAEDDRGELHEVGVDWEGKRIRLVSTKTHKYRVVPMVPKLEEVLLAAFASAPERQETISGISPHNLVRNGQRIARSAGMEPWASFFQAM